MDCNAINQTIREFHEAHGSCVCSGGWILYEDGARREKSFYGALIDPPQDKRQRAQNIVQYWQERLKLAVEEFTVFKREHLGNARIALKQSSVPAPSNPTEEVIEHLKELKKKVQNYRARLRKAEKQLEKNLPQRVKDLQELSNKNREVNEELLQQIESIEI